MSLRALPRFYLSTESCGGSDTSRKPVPVFDCPHGKEMLPSAWSHPPQVQPCAIPSCSAPPGSRAQHVPLLPLKDLQSGEHFSASFRQDNPGLPTSPHSTCLPDLLPAFLLSWRTVSWTLKLQLTMPDGGRDLWQITLLPTACFCCTNTIWCDFSLSKS